MGTSHFAAVNESFWMGIVVFIQVCFTQDLPCTHILTTHIATLTYLIQSKFKGLHNFSDLMNSQNIPEQAHCVLEMKQS
jgi:hypothetical protein